MPETVSVQPPPIVMIERSDGTRIACRHRAGTGPTIVFLPGYKSDMEGSKAVALDAWAAQTGRAMLRLDYSGCGASEGDFAAGTLSDWLADARLAIEHFAGDDPIVLVGSSMGGWIALLLAREMASRVHALVGIAAAPDFTQWGFDDAQKAALVRDGRLEEPSPYSDEPTLFTQDFWQSGQDNLVLDNPIPVTCPIRLLQGQMDPDVPWQIALRIAEQVGSADVQTLLIKQGDHRLSRQEDIALLVGTVAALP